MTPLKPIENLRVRGVAAERYPPNLICSHPECSENATEQHHAFPRSQIKSDSWFVEITGDEESLIIPHVTGVCNFHHGLVEMHLSWLKYEDGIWNWYERAEGEPTEEWIKYGPLNPQPGSKEGKPKRRKLQGEARRKRRTVSLKVPADWEDGGAVLDELLPQVREKLEQDEYENARDLPTFETIVAGLYGYVRRT